MLGVGLAFVGAGAPITAAILTYGRRHNGNGKSTLAPGSGERCQEHGEHLQRLDAAQEWSRNTLERIDKRTERLEEFLRGM